ncbi:hypothetical protein SE17_40645 [Kouleothrix aurantiaca]|jgi:two-component system response regulator YesN|uniref:Response regulatory domain-containing protein n=1 Tax=Kouleothrix aurantiaca TaxID=186479 RepID=A0A0P9D5F1_9CHLR|nr:hypothetical protein SE17_40645 [Kouleothrix aurantiaca]
MTLHSVLIVDDEDNQRFVVEQALRGLAYDWFITTASSVTEALASIACHVPDLIITDYNMPHLNGLDLVAQIRQRQIDTRIIFMTAYSSPELRQRVERLNIDYYITKPVPLGDLRRLAAAALEP